MALGGTQAGLMHLPSEREDVPIRVQLSRESRSSADALRGLYLNAPDGAMVPLGELALFPMHTEAVKAVGAPPVRIAKRGKLTLDPRSTVSPERTTAEVPERCRERRLPPHIPASP